MAVISFFAIDMEIITSLSNNRIKKVMQIASKSSVRKEEGLFVAEGTKLVREAPADWIEEVYVSETFFGRSSGNGREGCGDSQPEGFLKSLPDEKIIKVSEHVFEKVSTQKTPQGMLAVLKIPHYTEDDVKNGLNNESRNHNPLILVLEDIQDPGNVGTIFRTAEAAGVSGIVLSEKCADPYSPKTVRATMGAIFRLPFIVADDLVKYVGSLKNEGITSYAARLNGAETYYDCDFTKACVILVGNEGNGLSEELSDAASSGVYIPMSGQTESLNAAISASVLMYEARRQRSI